MKLSLSERQANALRSDLLVVAIGMQKHQVRSLQTYYANFVSMARRINQCIETQSAAPK